MSGVWKAPPTLRGVTRRTPSSWARADAGGEAVGRAGDHDLAGRVVVGDPARVGCGGARVVGLLGCRAEERGHPAGVGVGRGLGELGAARREPHARLEREDAGGDQRGDLAERVSRERDRRVGKRRERVPHDERGEQHRELRLAGAGERVGGRVGDEVTERLAERGFRVLDDRPARMITPRRGHAGLLGSLSGEDDRDSPLWCSLRLLVGVRSRGGRSRHAWGAGEGVRPSRAPVVTSGAVTRVDRVPSVDHYSRVTSVTHE